MFSFLKHIINNSNNSNKKEILIKDIKNTLEELNMLKDNFHFISGEAIDTYIFQINAVELKYKLLLNKLKKCD